MTEISDRERIRAAVASMLPPTARPWTIDVHMDEQFGRWNILLGHEASAGLGFDGMADAEATIEFVRAALTNHHELLRVARAPALTNPEAVEEVRTLAHHFDWTRDEVKAVARMVQQWAPLTDEEAEWLIESIGRDEAPRRPTFDF